MRLWLSLLRFLKRIRYLIKLDFVIGFQSTPFEYIEGIPAIKVHKQTLVEIIIAWLIITLLPY
jgi:hypothetical protein